VERKWTPDQSRPHTCTPSCVSPVCVLSETSPEGSEESKLTNKEAGRSEEGVRKESNELAVCFQGEMSDLRVVGDHRAAERLCDDEDDSDAVSGSSKCLIQRV